MADRKAELERKKAKLEQMRAERKRVEEEKKKVFILLDLDSFHFSDRNKSQV